MSPATSAVTAFEGTALGAESVCDKKFGAATVAEEVGGSVSSSADGADDMQTSPFGCYESNDTHCLFM